MKQKIIVRGPALSRSGYGEQCRFALRALKSREDLFDIYLAPTGWGQTGWLVEDDEERRWIDELIVKTTVHVQENNIPSMDMSLQVTIPNEWEKIAPVNIGYTAGIETTAVAPLWIEKSQIVDHIITVSEHSKRVYSDTSYHAKNELGQVVDENYKCNTPITVVHYPVRDFPQVDLDLNLDYDFNFLTIAQWGWRKNLDNTIRWFVEEFIDQEVGLVLKINCANDSIPDRFDTESRLKELLAPYKERKCKIYLLHGAMRAAELDSLYKHPKIKAYTTLTHGEGFGLPIFEAAYNGLPVIAPSWSGHVDFLHMPFKNKKGKRTKIKPKFAQVEYDINRVPPNAVWEHVIPDGVGCCYARQGSYKMQLRSVYKNHTRFNKQAKELQGWIKEEFTERRKYKEFVKVLEKLLSAAGKNQAEPPTEENPFSLFDTVNK